MDEEKKALLNRVISFDPIDEAEKLAEAGEIPKKAVTGLGFLFLQKNSEIKRNLFESEGDIHFSIEAIKAMGIIKSLGFIPVLTDPFYSDSSEKNETFIIYWNPEGFLLTFESYNGHVNSAKLHFEVLERKKGDYKKIWQLHSSGGFTKTKTHNKMRFCGDMDVREGLKLAIENLRDVGKVQNKWRGDSTRHFFWFINHQEVHTINETVGKDDWNCKSRRYDMITNGRLKRLPDYVRSAIWR